jgi:hypothetical protein
MMIEVIGRVTLGDEIYNTIVQRIIERLELNHAKCGLVTEI